MAIWSDFTLTVPTLFSFTQQQTRYNHVDGWGTLYLPADTFEVLRVKSVLDRIDSAYIEQFGQGFQFPEPQTVEYKWIAQGMDLPVLVITTVGGQPTTARFHYSPADIITGVAQHGVDHFRVWPNPADGEAWLRLPADAAPLVELRDAQGRMLRAERMTPGAVARLTLAGLAPGPYMVCGGGPHGRYAQRILVR